MARATKVYPPLKNRGSLAPWRIPMAKNASTPTLTKVAATASWRDTLGKPASDGGQGQGAPDEQDVAPELGEPPQPLVGEVPLGQLPPEERGDDDDEQARAQEHLQAPAVGHEQEDHRRPQDVELLLDRQRPEVPEDTHVVAEEAPVPVGVIEDHRREAADGAVTDRRRRGQDHPDGDEGEEEPQGGQQPQRPPGVEVAQRDATRPSPFLEQEGGDEEAGEHEEHVDADEPARQRPLPEVADDHPGDGDRPQTVEGGAVAEALLGGMGGARRQRLEGGGRLGGRRTVGRPACRRRWGLGPVLGARPHQAVVSRALAQSAWSQEVPSPASVTTSRIDVAPVTLRSMVLGLAAHVTTPLL